MGFSVIDQGRSKEFFDASDDAVTIVKDTVDIPQVPRIYTETTSRIVDPIKFLKNQLTPSNAPTVDDIVDEIDKALQDELPDTKGIR